jgi:hypothetical protein
MSDGSPTFAMTEAGVPLDHARIAKLREYLQLAQRLMTDHTESDPTWAGLPGSRAAAEAADPNSSEALLHELNGAYAFAQVRMLAVLEYAESISLLCSADDGPEGSLAIDVLTRSAVETASRAFWVLEYDLTVEHRTSRYLAIEVHSANHLDRLAKAMKLPLKYPQEVPTQMAAVQKRCNQAGLKVTMETKERPKVGNERLPSATDLVRTLVEDTPFAHEDTAVYELGSGVAHGASYALLRSYDISIGDQPADRRLASRLPVDHRIVEAAVAMLLFAFISLFRRVVALTGWDQIAVHSLDADLQAFLDDGPLVFSNGS